jgi:hypothetical protein
VRRYEYLSEKPNNPCVFLYGQSDDLKEKWQKNQQFALHFVRLLADIAIKCKLYDNFNFKATAQSAVCRFFVLLLQPENVAVYWRSHSRIDDALDCSPPNI